MIDPTAPFGAQLLDTDGIRTGAHFRSFGEEPMSAVIAAAICNVAAGMPAVDLETPLSRH